MGHLLTHTSGLPAHLPLYRQVKGKQEIVKKVLHLPLEYETGRKSEYSDLGIILLGDIIGKLTGSTLDTLSFERIFQPLGMSQTFFNPPANIRSKIAPTERDPWRRRLLQGEVHDENTFAMGGVAGHAGLFGTSGDLAIFCQMILNGGVYDHHRVVFRSTLEKFTARQQSRPAAAGPSGGIHLRKEALPEPCFLQMHSATRGSQAHRFGLILRGSSSLFSSLIESIHHVKTTRYVNFVANLQTWSSRRLKLAQKSKGRAVSLRPPSSVLCFPARSPSAPYQQRLSYNEDRFSHAERD